MILSFLTRCPVAIGHLFAIIAAKKIIFAGSDEKVEKKSQN